MLGKKDKNVEEFWQEYEEKTGEKVITRTLGQYISGWEEFDIKGSTNIWGLLIATSGGFRFHHFPQNHWLTSIMSSSKPGKEKTIFIPKEKIISIIYQKETAWWKKLLKSIPQRIIINYKDYPESDERRLILDSSYNLDDLVAKLPTAELNA
jgi:hypothetical protein